MSTQQIGNPHPYPEIATALIERHGLTTEGLEDPLDIWDLTMDEVRELTPPELVERFLAEGPDSHLWEYRDHFGGLRLMVATTIINEVVYQLKEKLKVAA